MSGPRAVLHIGSDKTGSTALQAALARRRSELADRGVWYPDLDGRPDHLSLARGPTNPPVPPPGVDTMVLSSEALWPLPAERIGALLAGLPGQVTVLAYLRDPVDFAEAAFLQRCRLARSERHLRLLAGLRHLPAPINPIVGRAVGRLRQLEVWAAEVDRAADIGDGRPIRLVIRPYRPDLWPGGDIVDDACRAAGLDPVRDLVADRPTPRVNPTPDLVAIHASLLVRRRAGPRAQARFLTDWADSADGADRARGRAPRSLPEGVRRRVAERSAPVLARLDRLAPGLAASLARPTPVPAGDDGVGAAEDKDTAIEGTPIDDMAAAWARLDRVAARALLAQVWPDGPPEDDGAAGSGPEQIE